ncbi:MAG TPA: M48 family metallopeptidase [Ignavibacteriales bacterium]|nr:M48 family metallopeptidase [Ignavibacteriales bacterium]
MKRFKNYYFLFIVLALFSLECSTVPLTGRKQLDLVPASQMLSMSFQQYDQFLKQNKLSTDANATAMVKRVGTRIQHAVEKYFADNNLSDQLKGYQWEFNLIESKEVNAWCMPGGKVVVYTGILPLTQDESGLAVVLGHEISHAVAKHGDERMSQALLTQLGGVALQVALRNKPQQTQQLFLAAFGAGAQVGILLPFSRTQESEADHLGLIFMSMAGYDPHTAVPFWERMMAQSKGAPPEFLSDHPSDQNRINAIKNEIPEAMKYFNKG